MIEPAEQSIFFTLDASSCQNLLGDPLYCVSRVFDFTLNLCMCIDSRA